MKKVLILTNYDLGLYKFRKELIRELIRRDCRVYLALPDGDLIRPLEKMGCNFINTPMERRGMNPLKDGKLLKQYISIIKQINPDQVITYTIKPNIYGGLACQLTHTPYAANITGLGTAFQKEGPLKRSVIALYKAAFRKADTIFFENKANAKTFLKHHIIKRDRMTLLRGAGVNLTEYPMTPYPLELENGPIHMLFIGRVMKEKGIDEIIEVAKRLKEKQTKKVIFDIVGPCEEGEKTDAASFGKSENRSKTENLSEVENWSKTSNRSETENQNEADHYSGTGYEPILKQLEAQGILHYHGYQEDVQPYIRQAHCFILPSYHEGMANTLLECGAMGRPLITSDIPGCREAVAVGKNGLLCKPEDVDSLQEKVEEFLAMSEEKHKEMGRNSRKVMEKRFDKRKVVEKTLEELML